MEILVPVMTPAPGDRWQRFVGDRVRFVLRDRAGHRPAAGSAWRARLRTNLGRAAQLRQEILEAHTRGLVLAGASWRDLPMHPDADGWSLEMPLAEVGFFKAKAYLIDSRGWQHWPEGPDFGVSVHPDRYRTANLVYCAFTRMFGASRAVGSTLKDETTASLRQLDQQGYTVIPPSGKLRDLIGDLPHIIGTLGCRVIHLLPVHPTPTTYARFGRFGSPYAALDLTAIDPALVTFDKRSTGVEQFEELCYETHRLGARVFLDLVINHTGWGSVLQEQHPEWFLRQPDGSFASPGAWGVTWEDLVEVKHQNVELWDQLSEVFLTWCRRGVDGFRCDAGYMVPPAAWQYIIARVRQEYPEALFLLEGLGGAWEATEALLTEGGMQWAYSELFQNHSALQVSGYLDHSLRESQRVGLLLHYSETHDNERLAAKGRAWSLLRNRLCGLTSVSGGFGFTCGVEWLASEKIRVHGSAGMNWGSGDNIIPEMSRLNQLLAEHPCFFDGARLTRLSLPDSAVYALRRESAEGKDEVLILVNTDVDAPGELVLDGSAQKSGGQDVASRLAPGGAQTTDEPDDVSPCPQSQYSLPAAKSSLIGTRTSVARSGRAGSVAADSSIQSTGWVDLLGQKVPSVKQLPGGKLRLTLPAGAAFCLANSPRPLGLHGEDYRRTRAQAAWGLAALSRAVALEEIGSFDWRELAMEVESSPFDFLARVAQLECRASSGQSRSHLDHPAVLPPPLSGYPRVVTWTVPDCRRVTLVPPGHWLLLQDTVPFGANLKLGDNAPAQNVESIPVSKGQVACFPPQQRAGEGFLCIDRCDGHDRHSRSVIRFLAPMPCAPPAEDRVPQAEDLVLLTNGRGGMARLRVDFGKVLSKYDCVLGANLHPGVPVDRHVFAKRIRVWVNADGFISPLDALNLERFRPGPPATWDFVANAGDGRTVQIQITAEMIPGRNTTVFRFERPGAAQAVGKQLPDGADVCLSVRLDLEDRNFHSETKRNSGADHHFSSHLGRLGELPAPENSVLAGNEQAVGFAFTPAADRQLRVVANQGAYHPQPEWSENLPHPLEQSRGQVGSGDAFSPGWFELPLPKGGKATVAVTAELPVPAKTRDPDQAPLSSIVRPGPDEDWFYSSLARAVRAFVVDRNEGKTVIAGYPWFLDWGRDTFICARGLLAAGMTEEVKQMLLTFGRFEKGGTLPNTIFGEDASNRDTSDAPLWYALVCAELAAQVGSLELVRPTPERSLGDVLASIAQGYVKGTPNGIRMDPASGLIWSPSHFTWMDTNYPACTPREGYPVEIQALWVRLLRYLAAAGQAEQRSFWEELSARAGGSLENLFWLEERGYYADALSAAAGTPAERARRDESLRSNGLLVVSLGLAPEDHSRRCVQAAARYLLVPGALRSLAPLPVSPPLPIYGPGGQLLNNPNEPYWGRYEGDEDTRRKPAYHNGTAWTWTMPGFCEALVRAWNFSPTALAAARAYLGSLDRLLAEGCLGQIPEILDGDAPHAQRGCDAQAWSVTEALRVWKLLRAAGD